MKDIKEGNLYNVETSKVSPNRSSELTDVNKIMMDQFWEAMSRQGISPEKAKEISRTTFGDQSQTPKV
jgi:hypothetical protein